MPAKLMAQIADDSAMFANHSTCLTERKHGLTERKHGLMERKHGLMERKHGLTEHKHGLTEHKHGLTEHKHGLTEDKACRMEHLHWQTAEGFLCPNLGQPDENEADHLSAAADVRRLISNSALLAASKPLTAA